jgi:hypothetical protein
MKFSGTNDLTPQANHAGTAVHRPTSRSMPGPPQFPIEAGCAKLGRISGLSRADLKVDAARLIFAFSEPD